MDRSMTPLWSRSLHLRPAPGSLAAAADVVVVAERHSRLVGLDPHTGATLWEQRVEDCWGTTVVAGRRCLHLSGAGVLHCVDLDSGRRQWLAPDLRLSGHLAVSGPVVLVGGWRGYRPLIRIDLATGERLPGHVPAPAVGGAPAWPLSLRLASGADAVLLAAAGEPSLALVDVATGGTVDAWDLPAPVRSPDLGAAFGLGDDDRVVFVSGARTVLAFDPARGVQPLWEHDRELAALPPVLRRGVLWLADDAGVAVVDLATGAAARPTPWPDGAVRAVAPLPDGALVARTGEVAAVDRAGRTTRLLRTPAPVDAVVTGADALAHILGKGRLTTAVVG